MISNKNKAFTLVELLVVMIIIVILSLIILPKYKSIQQQLALERAAIKLAQDIRRVEEMAMSAKEFEGEIPSGYGIYLRKVSSQTSYILYADKIPNQKYDPGEEKIEEINLESGIKIFNLSGNHNNIIFTPPDPTVFFTDADGIDLELDQVSIVISLISDETKRKTISVNKAGLINAD